jgi:hypothetical protein
MADPTTTSDELNDPRRALAQQEPTDEDVLRCLAPVADKALLVDHPSDVIAAGRNLLARWGADQELEACIHWLITGPYGASIACNADHMISDLRAARRPKPPAGFFPVEYADADGDGIKILMEPADETGRVCWVVRDSRHVNPCREFPTPEAAYAAHRTAADAGKVQP